MPGRILAKSIGNRDGLPSVELLRYRSESGLGEETNRGSKKKWCGNAMPWLPKGRHG